jgi:hypothetical protein
MSWRLLRTSLTVRDTSTACRFDLQVGQALDFSRADVTFDDGAGTSTLLPNVEGLLGCASTPQGWFYDTPPPTRRAASTFGARASGL